MPGPSLAQLRADLSTAQANVATAEDNYNAILALGTPSQINTAELQVIQYQNKLSAAEAALNAALAKPGSTANAANANAAFNDASSNTVLAIDAAATAATAAATAAAGIPADSDASNDINFNINAWKLVNAASNAETDADKLDAIASRTEAISGALSETYPNVSNTSTMVTVGPNFQINNNDDNGSVSTSLPIKAPSISLNGKSCIDTLGNASFDGTVTATGHVLRSAIDGQITHEVDTTGNVHAVGGISIGSGSTSDLTSTRTLTDGTTATPTFMVDSSGNITTDGHIVAGKDIVSLRNMYSNTTYQQYVSNTYKPDEPNMVVNKAILDQVVQNITGGDAASIDALRNLVEAFNSQDVSVLSTVLSYQNNINNELLKQIDRLYTYMFRDISSVITDADMFGPPDNVYYSSAVGADNAANLTVNDYDEIEFIQPDASKYTAPTVSITGTINTGTDTGATGAFGAGAGANTTGGPGTTETVSTSSTMNGSTTTTTTTTSIPNLTPAGPVV